MDNIGKLRVIISKVYLIPHQHQLSLYMDINMLPLFIFFFEKKVFYRNTLNWTLSIGHVQYLSMTRWSKNVGGYSSHFHLAMFLNLTE